MRFSKHIARKVAYDVVEDSTLLALALGGGFLTAGEVIQTTNAGSNKIDSGLTDGDALPAHLVAIVNTEERVPHLEAVYHRDRWPHACRSGNIVPLLFRRSRH